MAQTGSELINQADTLEEQFEKADVELPDLVAEDEIESGKLTTNLPDGFYDASVSGIDVGTRVGTGDDGTKVYKIFYTFYGIDWEAHFNPQFDWQMEQLGALLNRHNVDIDAPANLIGKNITVYVNWNTPVVVTHGPVTKELQEIYTSKPVCVFAEKLAYRPFRQSMMNLSIMCASILPIAAVGYFMGLDVFAFLSLLFLIMGTIIGVVGGVFGLGFTFGLPQVEFYQNVDKVVQE